MNHGLAWALFPSKTLPPYLSIIPPDGIVGEGEGRHKRFLSYLLVRPSFASSDRNLLCPPSLRGLSRLRRARILPIIWAQAKVTSVAGPVHISPSRLTRSCASLRTKDSLRWEAGGAIKDYCRPVPPGASKHK